ncbi:MAG: RnfABCDGE type electron transport complex subunit D, partial [Azovibrio sp.]
LEAILLKMQDKPVAPFLMDGSALVTAWLIALAFPPLSPWWLTVTGVFFAIVIAKQLYGGLGQNPFNPAMIGFAACIVAFPSLMAQWPSPDMALSLRQQIDMIFGLAPRIDGMTAATSLDALKTSLKMTGSSADVQQLLGNPSLYGQFASRNWEWIALAYLSGGLFLCWKRIITWHVPVAFITGMALISGGFWFFNPSYFAPPLFHLFSGGVMLGAFFIATDPVSGCTTPRGKLIFGLGVGILTYLIRVFGTFPDGIAFAVLIMNLCAPVIDLFSQPAVFGRKEAP